MTSLMTSPGHKIGQILKLIYLRHYLHYSVDQKLKMSDMLMAIVLVYHPTGITSGKMSEMLMAIFLVYSTSGITSGKKIYRELKIATILKILKY